MAVVFNLGTNGNWAYGDANLLPYYVDTNNKYNGVPMSAFRAGIATRTTREGLIESMTVDIPRIDFAENANGQLLAEDESENRLLYSNDFANAYWTKSVNINITPSYGIAPNGEQESTLVNLTFGVTAYMSKNISYGGGDESSTIWVKGVQGETVKFGRGANVAQGDLYTLNGGWERIEFNNSIDTGSQFLISNYSGATAENFEIWEAQLEDTVKATSNIYTNGSAETRAADTGITTGDISHLINSEEGVFEVKCRNQGEGAGLFRSFSISDGTLQNRAAIQYWNDNTRVRFRYMAGNVVVYEYFYTPTDITDEFVFKLKYKSNDFAASVNGVEVDSQNTGVTLPNLFDRAGLNDGSGISYFFGRTDYVKIYDSADDY